MDRRPAPAGIRLRRLRDAAGKTERDVEEASLASRTTLWRIETEQEARLRELAGLDHVDIRIIPWDAGAHAAIHLGPLTIVDFPDPDDPPVVYLETHTGARYLEKPEELAEYRRIHELIHHKSIPIEEYPP